MKVAPEKRMSCGIFNPPRRVKARKKVLKG
jgi:hypothetical protein